MGRIIRNTISYGFVTLILAALGFCIYLFLDDLDGPEVTMTPDTGRISPTQEITLKLADAKSGVRSVVVPSTAIISLWLFSIKYSASRPPFKRLRSTSRTRACGTVPLNWKSRRGTIPS